MTTPRFVLISGKRYSGKDTTAQILKQIPQFEQHPILHFADSIKQEYCDKKGMTLEELEREKEKHRQGLIKIGQERRKQNKNYWVDKILDNYEKGIIADWRLPSELTPFVKKYSNDEVLTIRVKANEEEREKRGWEESSIDENITETGLDDQGVNILLKNNESLNAFEKRVKFNINLWNIL